MTAKRIVSHAVPPSQSVPPPQHAVTAAIYMRVSTVDRGQSVDMQLLELREYLARRGWTIGGEYVDQGVSGSKDSRPALNRLMVDAHRRRFDAVVCYRYDRFPAASATW